jgi:hypothetical protein
MTVCYALEVQQHMLVSKRGSAIAQQQQQPPRNLVHIKHLKLVHIFTGFHAIVLQQG